MGELFSATVGQGGFPVEIPPVCAGGMDNFTRRRYARFSPDSASRAVLFALEGHKTGTGVRVICLDLLQVVDSNGALAGLEPAAHSLENLGRVLRNSPFFIANTSDTERARL